MKLEEATGAELTRQMLCQKSYAGIWRELDPALDVEPGTPQPAKKTTRLMAEGIKTGIFKDRRNTTSPGRRDSDTQAYAALEAGKGA